MIRHFAWHFVTKRLYGRVRASILQAVLAAQEQGVKVIGLGALVKAEWLTEGGKWIVDQLGDKLRTPVVHGDTLTAALVVERAVELVDTFGLRGMPIMLTGGTSKIGRAVALELSSRGHLVRLVTMRGRSGLEVANRIRSESSNPHLIEPVGSLEGGSECGLWITGKSSPGGRELLAVMPEGAVVLNFAVPDPLSLQDLASRPDIRHFDGGLAGYATEDSTQRFTMRLRPGVTYACHAATLVHAHMGWTHHEVGPIEMSQMAPTLAAAKARGIVLPSPTSHLRPTSSPIAEIRPPVGTSRAA